ncbi:MAG: sulfotransferase [Halomonadaceae bacterium]|nr:MAG: sulfotransferase [Halomonadaceae bacterium]
MAIKIIYLLGLGHSGTTLLGRLLGAHSQVIATGGTKNIPLFVKGRKTCACGATAPTECQLWSAVEERLKTRDLSLSDLQFGYDNQNNLNHDALKRYFESVLEASGAQAIVDTSRRRSYFAELEKVPGVELIPVHLFKDPRAQFSSAKRKNGNLFASVWSYNLRGRRVRGMQPAGRPVLHLSYESLCRDPMGQIARIMEAAGLPFEPDQVTHYGASELHIIGGNRQRHDTSSAIRLDESWRRRLTPMEQKLAIWLGGRSYRKNLTLSES